MPQKTLKVKRKKMSDEEIIEEEVIEEEGFKDKLNKLREALKLCQKEKAEYLAGWQRAKADFINARKDEERARMEFLKYAAEKVLREMLAVVDSLEIAGAASAPIYAQLREILKREGALPIEARNAKFDPYFHEALEQVEVSEKEKDGIVIEELQKGYMIYDRVLRPSKVKVGHYEQVTNNE